MNTSSILAGFLFAVAAAPAGAETPPVVPVAKPEISVPPPASGRSLTNPDSITSADALARVGLIHDNLQLIRQYMGRAASPPPLLRVEGARAREVWFQSYNLVRRANQLAFEHLRTPLERPKEFEGAMNSAAILRQLDDALVAVLRVKQALGIEAVVPERPRPESTTQSEVFNAIVEAGQLMHVVLEQKTSDSDVYAGVTMAIHAASAMHARQTKAFLPDDPPFEPNKTSADVYRALHRCLNKIRALSEAMDVPMLRFELTEAGMRQVDADDTSELVALMIAEIAYLYTRLFGEGPTVRPYVAGRRYPAHTYQRARRLEAILDGLVAAAEARRKGK